MWAEVRRARLCEWRVMTGQICSNDRDLTISYHNTNQTHPGLVSVLLPPLKKGVYSARGAITTSHLPIIHWEFLTQRLLSVHTFTLSFLP